MNDRNLSLELHPDKNKSPTAADDFNRVKQAFDVLMDKEKRREYNRLGMQGVKALRHVVIDHKYLILNNVVMKYATTLIFAFMITFSDGSEAMSWSLFGLAFMLLIECLLVLIEYPLPSWFLPYHTAAEVVSVLHRTFPAFMNGMRCILGAFHDDRKQNRLNELDKLASHCRETNAEVMVMTLLHITERSNTDDDFEYDTLIPSESAHIQDIQQKQDSSDSNVEDKVVDVDDSDVGFMNKTLSTIQRRYSFSKEGRNGIIEAQIKDQIESIKDPQRLIRKTETLVGQGNTSFVCIRDILLYLIARYIFVK